MTINELFIQLVVPAGKVEKGMRIDPVKKEDSIDETAPSQDSFATMEEDDASLKRQRLVIVTVNQSILNHYPKTPAFQINGVNP